MLYKNEKKLSMIVNDEKRHDYYNEQQCYSKLFMEIQADILGMSACSDFAFLYFLYVCTGYYTLKYLYYYTCYIYHKSFCKRNARNTTRIRS